VTAATPWSAGRSYEPSVKLGPLDLGRAQLLHAPGHEALAAQIDHGVAAEIISHGGGIVRLALALGGLEVEVRECWFGRRLAGRSIDKGGPRSSSVRRKAAQRLDVMSGRAAPASGSPMLQP
jgi:hypothetical protein